MTDHDDFDLERSAARAWDALEDRLTHHLERMSDDDSVVIEQLTGDEPDDGAVPYVQFAGFGEDFVRGEVSGNKYLASMHALDVSAEQELIAQGWHPPEDHNFYLHVDKQNSARLAVMAVRALRDVFHVPHPAFLTTTNPEVARLLGLGGAPIEAPVEAPEEPLALLPESPDHLRELVDQALLPMLGHLPSKDSDGDIPIPYNSTLVFIRVHDDEPLVELFSFVVREITDLDAARVEVGILNRDRKFIKFVARNDWIFAHVQIPSYPFVPRMLRSMLELMCTSLDEVDDDLALRTGGRRALEPSDEIAESSAGATTDPQVLEDSHLGASSREADHRGLLDVLIEKDHHGAEALSPHVVRALAGGSREVLRESLGTARELESGWRAVKESAALNDDRDGRGEAEAQGRMWARIGNVLARALKEEQSAAANPVTGTALKKMYRDFWRRFEVHARRRGWTKASAPARHWWSMPAGGSGNAWGVSFSRSGCRVELYLGHPDPAVNLHRLRLLARQASRIQDAFGAEHLVFDDLPHAKACRIEARLEGPHIADIEVWDEVVAWMVDRQERLRSAIDSVGGVPDSLPDSGPA